MKIALPPRRAREEGSALTIALISAMLITISLASYLNLVATQNRSTLRSMSWAAALPAAEAGVEEALTHLCRNGVDNLSNPDWTLKEDGWYQRCGSLGGALAYVVRIQPSTPPRICATGISRAPNGPSAIEPTEGGILGAALDKRNFVTRTVEIVTRPEITPFKKAVIAKSSLDLQGNRLASDSFDSEDETRSTKGRYDRKKRRDRGEIASSRGITDSDIRRSGEAEIMGKISTSHDNELHLGNNGAIGDRDWIEGARQGVQDSHHRPDLSFNLNHPKEPFTMGRYPDAEVDANGKRWDHVLKDGDYVISTLTGQVRVDGHARIYVTSSLQLADRVSEAEDDCIYINDGARLQVYMAGEETCLDGKGVVNESGKASCFKYYGLESNKRIKVSGKENLCGAIYAPEAEIEVGDDAGEHDEFTGSCVGKEVKLISDCSFHYDEALERDEDENKECRGYVAEEYSQLPKDTELPGCSYSGVEVTRYNDRS
jgi:hypothetical protein